MEDKEGRDRSIRRRRNRLRKGETAEEEEIGNWKSRKMEDNIGRKGKNWKIVKESEKENERKEKRQRKGNE